MLAGMSETQTETPVASVNGQHAGPVPDAPCEDCGPTSGERMLGIVAAGFGLFIIAMAADMITGGKVFGFLASIFGTSQAEATDG